MADVRIGLLGPLEVRAVDGTEIPVPGARLRALLTALALEPGKTVPLERLVDAAWGARPPQRPANAVQALVSRLRKAGIGISAQPQGYRLVITPDAVDVTTFERLVREGHRQEAMELWRGPALLEVRGTEYFAAWVAKLEELRLTALEDGSISELTELVAENPLRERLVGALMRALAAAGRSADALRLYDRTRKALAEELGADPSAELSELHTEILRGAPETNLRAALTSFVGRSAEVAEVRRLVGEYRLTTLTGPGGSGKTRLAVEAARAIPGEVWLVELAALSDDVPEAILSTLGIRDLDALRTRDVLLVLDNCEHLIDEVAHVADKLLGACPSLRILATSREPLGITGEAVCSVEPLALPPADSQLPDALAYPAVRLLLERAHPGFTPTRAIVRICRALDGIPLAIELAAALLRTMTADQVASRLDDRFRLLTKGSRTALPRHQTLKAVIDWSWDLLSSRERTVLCRLAVFADGATLEAAEHVCGPDAVDVLTALADKSLVIAGERYRMLETIKAYCLERLEDPADARQAHASYFIALAETADPYLRRSAQVAWLARMHAEDANINSALLVSDAQTAVRLTAAVGWYWLLEWSLRCRRVPGVSLGARALSLPGSVDPEPRATASAAVAQFNLLGNGDEEQALDWLATAQRLGGRHPMVQLVSADPSASGDPWVRAMGRLHAAIGSINTGNPDEASLVASLAEFRALGERWGILNSLTHLADLASWRGDLAAAVAGYQEAVDVVEEIVDGQDAWKPRLRLAQLLWLHGSYDASALALSKASRDAARIGLPEAMTAAAYTAADIARWSGDLDAARSELAKASSLAKDLTVNWGFRALLLDLSGYLTGSSRADALVWARRSHSAPLIAHVLIGQADAALRSGDHAEAERLLAESVAVRGTPDLSNPDAARIQAELSDPHG